MDAIFDNNSSSDEESEAVLNTYYTNQSDTVSKLNSERARELKAQVFNVFLIYILYWQDLVNLNKFSGYS